MVRSRFTLSVLAASCLSATELEAEPNQGPPALRISARAAAGALLTTNHPASEHKTGGGFTTRLSAGARARVHPWIAVGAEVVRVEWHKSFFPSNETILVPMFVGEKSTGRATVQIGLGLPIRFLERSEELNQGQILRRRSIGFGIEGIAAGELLLGSSWSLGLELRAPRIGSFFRTRYDRGDYEAIYGRPPSKDPESEGVFFGGDAGVSLSFRL